MFSFIKSLFKSYKKVKFISPSYEDVLTINDEERTACFRAIEVCTSNSTYKKLAIKTLKDCANFHQWEINGFINMLTMLYVNHVTKKISNMDR